MRYPASQRNASRYYAKKKVERMDLKPPKSTDKFRNVTINRANKRMKVVSSFMIAGFGVLGVAWLTYLAKPETLPVLICTVPIYFVVSTVLVVRAVRAIKNVK